MSKCLGGASDTPNHVLVVPSRCYNVLPRLVTYQTIICGALTVSKCLVGCYAGVTEAWTCRGPPLALHPPHPLPTVSLCFSSERDRPEWLAVPRIGPRPPNTSQSCVASKLSLAPECLSAFARVASWLTPSPPHCLARGETVVGCPSD